MLFHITSRLRHTALAVTVTAAALASPEAARAATTPLGVPTSVSIPAGVIQGVAYDDKHDVYLATWEANRQVWARFLNHSGQPIGAAFSVATALQTFAGCPRVAYSERSAEDVFLVAFCTDLLIADRSKNAFGQLIRYTGTGPTGGQLVGGNFDLSQFSRSAARVQTPWDVVYNPKHQRFLITWDDATNGADTWVRSFDAGGVPLTGDIDLNAGAGAGAQGASTVSYDWQADVYIAAWQGDNPISGGLGTFAVILNGTTGQPASPLLVLTSGGFPIELNSVYLPERGAFLVMWTQIGGTTRWVEGRLVAPNGAFVANGAGQTGVYTLMAGRNEGAVDSVYHPLTRTGLLASMALTKTVRGVEITGAGGVPMSAPYNLSNVLSRFAGDAGGSYNPKLVADDASGEFALTYTIDFTQEIFERFQGGIASTPGPIFNPCTADLSTASISSAAAGMTASINVTGDCTWTAASSVPWITVTSGGSGTGAGTVGLSIARNATFGTRTGSVAIAGRSVTITQTGLSAAAVVHDLNGDGFSDILWQHQTLGYIAAWQLQGTTVVGTPLIGTQPDSSWLIVGSGDLDGDGFADLVWQRNDGFLAIWTMRGRTITGTSLLSINRVADTNWRIRGVGDVNGDGRADLLWQHTSGYLAVWLMNGATVVAPMLLDLTQPDPNWRMAGAGDISFDGKADVIWHNRVTGELAAWLLDGNHVTAHEVLFFGGNAASVPDVNWKVRGVGDVNGDGFADLIWRNEATGLLGVWYLNGFNITFQSGLSLRVVDPNWLVVGPG